MSAVSAFVVAVFVYRDMRLSDVPRLLLSSANVAVLVFDNQLKHHATAGFMAAFPEAMTCDLPACGKYLLLVAGNVMEPSPIVLIMAPILFPLAVKLGVDQVHFGILITLNMYAGICHPPVGLSLYVASGTTEMGITELSIAVWPSLFTLLSFLVLVTYCPAVSLRLPRTWGMM